MGVAAPEAAEGNQASPTSPGCTLNLLKAPAEGALDWVEKAT